MITALLFVKGTGESDVEAMVAHAQVAASMDTLDQLGRLPEVGRMVVATSSAGLIQYGQQMGAQVEPDPPGADFHFGKRLSSLVSKYHAEHALYVGGGSGVLMTQSDWEQITRNLVSEPDSVIVNNYYSCDFCGWSPANAIDRIDPPALDNDLAYRLGERAGLHPYPLERNAATQFDIDTPADLLILATRAPVGQHMQRFLAAASLDASRVQRLRELIGSRSSTLFTMGRVSAAMAAYLERETPCQWRILSEERGMRASGREARGEVRSLLGVLLDTLEPAEFFNELGRLCDGAIVDTRVVFAHRHLHPTASDRFHSDLLDPDRIVDPFVRELTAAAKDADFPILLGGHSVVSGGMFALNLR